MTIDYTTFSTPFGEFSAAMDHSGRVVATAFGGLADLQSRIAVAAEWRADASRLADVKRQVLAYCAGSRTAFDLPLAAAGSEFQRRVWAELVRIPYGETRSYAEVAGRVASAPRAVGRANATNPICLIVPCHRVIGADGSLTGFAFGEETKRRLLDHEAAIAARRNSGRAPQRRVMPAPIPRHARSAA